MENEHAGQATGGGAPTGANGVAAGAGPLPGGLDIGELLKMAKTLTGGGERLPEWIYWALGAGAAGALLSMLFGKSSSPQHYVQSEPVTLGPSHHRVPDRLARLRALRDLGPARELPLGFFQSGIGKASGAIDVISRPQVPFLGERLVIPKSTASLFALIDVKVGNRSQFSNSTAIPASTFTEESKVVNLRLDPADIAMDIALVVENITEDNQTFQAALLGTAAEPCDACGGYGRAPSRLADDDLGFSCTPFRVTRR
jgi:hypothetical protein